MLKKLICSHFVLLIVFCCASTSSYCQSDIKAITKSFDKIVGYSNLDISNGIFLSPDYPYILNHQNKYFVNTIKGPSVNSTNQSFQNTRNTYTKGNVTYNDNQYYDVELKYDLSKDILIYHPKEASYLVACKLIQHKVDSFSIYEKRFIRLRNLDLTENVPDFKGYYQKIKIDENFIFYIKYDKNKQEHIKGDKVYYSYPPNYEFWLYYHKDYIEISSKNDVLDTFPALSEEIQKFYKAQEFLKDSNLPLFYKKLMFYMNDYLDS